MTTTEEIKNEVSQDFINTARSSKDEDIDLFDEAIAPSYNNSGSEEVRIVVDNYYFLIYSRDLVKIHSPNLQHRIHLLLQ